MDQFHAAKLLSLFLLSAVKLFFAPGAALAAGYNFWQTFLITGSGGVFGVIVFYFFGHLIFSFWENIRHRRYARKGLLVPPRRSFSRRNRFIVTFKEKFGIIGLALVTPALLSIPVGSVVAARFYYGNKRTLPLLIFSTLGWAFGLSFFFAFLKSRIFFE